MEKRERRQHKGSLYYEYLPRFIMQGFIFHPLFFFLCPNFSFPCRLQSRVLAGTVGPGVFITPLLPRWMGAGGTGAGAVDSRKSDLERVGFDGRAGVPEPCRERHKPS